MSNTDSGWPIGSSFVRDRVDINVKYETKAMGGAILILFEPCGDETLLD
jgi:hypothetical protein